MKKKRIIFTATLILIVIIVAIFFTVVSLSRDKEKSSINPVEFKQILETKSYTITDVKNQFSNYDFITDAYLASTSDYSYQIEYYQFTDNKNAINFYNTNKSAFYEMYKNIVFEKFEEKDSYSKCILKTNDYYLVISRIANTLIYIDVPIEYLDDIDSLLKEIGY